MRFVPSGRSLLRRAAVGEEAATMVEYALMIALIVLVAFTAVQLFGQSTSSVFADPRIPNAMGS